jgi:hypothetical protein
MTISYLGNERGALVHRRGCRCVKERWAWDSGERKRRRQVELRWRGAPVKEEAK